jgi:amidase
MAFAEYDHYDALGLAQLVRRGEVSPLELVDEAIARIERHNPTLNAVVYKAYDEARAVAKSKLPDGPFKGVPFLIKDINLPVAGWPMTNGSAWLRNYVSTEDCELVRRYRASGVVLVGKTNTPEFGIPGTTEGRHLGICRNPWNPDHSAGGSSGGAASAVASGMVAMAHGSDGLGSIRIPAAQCGLVGVKPTQFRNPGGPDDRNRAHGLIVDHVLTRSLRDSAAMLDWTGYAEDDAPYAPAPKAGTYSDDIKTPPGKLRIAFTTEVPRKMPPHPDVQAVFDATVKLLGELGHTMIEKPELPIDWKKLYRAQSAVSGAMFAASIDDWTAVLGHEPREEDFEPLAWASYRGSKQLSSSQIGTGLQNLRLMSRHIAGTMARIRRAAFARHAGAAARDRPSRSCQCRPSRIQQAAIPRVRLYAALEHDRAAFLLAAARHEFGQASHRHDVHGALRRRVHVVPAGCATRTGASLAGPPSHGLGIVAWPALQSTSSAAVWPAAKRPGRRRRPGARVVLHEMRPVRRHRCAPDRQLWPNWSVPIPSARTIGRTTPWACCTKRCAGPAR